MNDLHAHSNPDATVLTGHDGQPFSPRCISASLRGIGRYRALGIGLSTPQHDLDALEGLAHHAVLAANCTQPFLLEVGSWCGESALAIATGCLWAAEELLYINPRSHLFCVDHFQGSPHDFSGDVAQYTGPMPERLCQVAATQINRDPRICCEICRYASTEAVPWVAKRILELAPPDRLGEDGRPLLDFIYLDAGHTYDEVLLDLRTWVPLLRPGGILCGHDYWKVFPGVIEAVDEFCHRELGVAPLLLDGTAVWCVTH